MSSIQEITRNERRHAHIGHYVYTSKQRLKEYIKKGEVKLIAVTSNSETKIRRNRKTKTRKLKWKTLTMKNYIWENLAKKE